MKKITLLMLGMLMITSAGAEENEYVPLVREGAMWYFLRYQGYLNRIYLTADYLYSYNFEGDTIVEDKGEYDNLRNVTYNAVFRGVREESKVVYVKNFFYWKHELPSELLDSPLIEYPYWAGWDEENSQFYTEYNDYEVPIYDFNRESFLPDDHGISNFFRKNVSATTVLVDGAVRYAYVIDDGVNYYTATVIEGVGIDSGAGQLLAPQYPLPSGVDSLDGLAWVEENGNIIYRGVMYDKAMEYLSATAITTIAGERQVAGVRYYNLAGVESAEPQPGVNIRVTTYTDGTRKSEKIIR